MLSITNIWFLSPCSWVISLHISLTRGIKWNSRKSNTYLFIELLVTILIMPGRSTWRRICILRATHFAVFLGIEAVGISPTVWVGKSNTLVITSWESPPNAMSSELIKKTGEAENKIPVARLMTYASGFVNTTHFPLWQPETQKKELEGPLSFTISAQKVNWIS